MPNRFKNHPFEIAGMLKVRVMKGLGSDDEQ
jgi:hypothetical protein